MKKQSKQTTAGTIAAIQAPVAKKHGFLTGLGALLLLLLSVSPAAQAETNSRSAQAVLNIRVTVMPVLLPAQQQAQAATASPITFNLQGERRAATVTQGPMPVWLSRDTRQMLETTTVVVD